MSELSLIISSGGWINLSICGSVAKNCLTSVKMKFRRRGIILFNMDHGYGTLPLREEASSHRRGSLAQIMVRLTITPVDATHGMSLRASEAKQQT